MASRECNARTTGWIRTNVFPDSGARPLLIFHSQIVQPTSAGGITSVEITLSRSAPTQVSWSVRESGAAPASGEVRTLADVKSLVTIGDADVRMVTLVDITVVRGDPRTFDVHIPQG